MVTRVNGGGGVPAQTPRNNQGAQQAAPTGANQGANAANQGRRADQTLTSEAVKQMGVKAGWDQAKIDAAIDKADGNNDNKFTANEFDALVAEMGTANNNAAVYADALLANPRFAKGWDAARKGMVQQEIERRAGEHLAIAEDPAKTPAERLNAAKTADKILKDAEKAAKDAGYSDIAGGLKDEMAKATTQVSAAKIRTGDQAALRQAIKEAGTDKAKLTAIRDLLGSPALEQAKVARDKALADLTAARDDLAKATADPNANPLDLVPKLNALNAAQAAFDAAQMAVDAAENPKAKVLTSIIDGKVNKEVAGALLRTMQDNQNDMAEFKKAIGASKGDPAALDAIATAMEAEAAGRPEADKNAAAMKAQAATLREIAKAPTPAVREALVKAMDGTDTFKGIEDARAAFAEATQGMQTKEDLAALQAFAKAKQAEGNKYFSDAFSHRLELVAANFDALKAEPAVFANIKNWIGDKTDSGKDVMAAVMATKNQATLDALQGIAEARGAYLNGDDLFDKFSSAFKSGALTDAGYLSMSPAERRAALQRVFPAAQHQALGIADGSKIPGEMSSQQAMELIKGTTIGGNRPTVADRAEEQARKDRDALQKAKEALTWIPASDPRRAEYEQMVTALQAAFDTKWPQPAPTATA